MLRYIALRLTATIPMLLGMSLLVFTLLRLIPGDAAHAILLAMADPTADTSRVTSADLTALREQLGLNEPYPVQYVHWLGDVVTGNLGKSFRSRTPVVQELAARLPATAELAVAALGMSGIYVIVNLVVDIVYRLIDPRVRVETGAAR